MSDSAVERITAMTSAPACAAATAWSASPHTLPAATLTYSSAGTGSGGSRGGALDPVGAQHRALDGDRGVRVDEPLHRGRDPGGHGAAIGDDPGVDRQRVHGPQPMRPVAVSQPAGTRPALRDPGARLS